MSDADPKTPIPEAPSRRSGSRFLVAGLVAVACAAVLYGIIRGRGKEAADGACAAAQPVAERLAPLAHGEIAALAIDKTPRPATPVTFDGPDGSPTHLADFRGKTVLLNLWATWCIPCREEMPALDKLQARLGSDRFQVVAVNIDTSRLERRKTFLKEAGITSLAFYSDSDAQVFQVLRKAGKVLGLPTTILVGPRGCQLGIMPGPADWASDDATRLVTAALAP